MENNYLKNYFDKAEKGFDDWVTEKTQSLSPEQKILISKKIQSIKKAVQSSLDHASIQFNGIMETVEKTKQFSPRSKTVIEFMEKQAKELFETSVDQAWSFLKTQAAVLIPETKKGA